MLVYRYDGFHLVAKIAKIIDLDDRLALVTSVGLSVQHVKKIALLVDLQLSHFFCRVQPRHDLFDTLKEKATCLVPGLE